MSYSELHKRIELPFTVKLVRTNEQMHAAISVREHVYRDRQPSLSSSLAYPEADDLLNSSVIFLAESKSDSQPLGSMRVQTNLNTPTEFETHIDLPDRLRNAWLVQVMRLGVTSGPNARLVRNALFKALYLYTIALQIDYVLVTAKGPTERIYTMLRFRKVFPDGIFVETPSNKFVPHTLFAANVKSLDSVWRRGSIHPIYEFMTQESHPDIAIFSSVCAPWSSRRQADRQKLEFISGAEFGLTVV
jgi:hypothetical protein